MKEKVLLKKECGEILFLQNETTVMVIKTEISHDKRLFRGNSG